MVSFWSDFPTLKFATVSLSQLSRMFRELLCAKCYVLPQFYPEAFSVKISAFLLSPRPTWPTNCSQFLSKC